MFASLCGFLVVLEDDEEEEDAFLSFDNLVKNIIFLLVSEILFSLSLYKK